MSADMIVVGLMSGTSLDGIAAACVRFRDAGEGAAPHYELLAFRNAAYAPEQRDRLARALVGASPAEYCRLHVDLGAWLADAARALLDASGGRVKTAIVMHALGTDRAGADRALEKGGGVIRRVVPGAPPPVA